jgi:hypothetical protein
MLISQTLHPINWIILSVTSVLLKGMTKGKYDLDERVEL